MRRRHVLAASLAAGAALAAIAISGSVNLLASAQLFSDPKDERTRRFLRRIVEAKRL